MSYQVYINGRRFLIWNKLYKTPPEIQTTWIVDALAVLMDENIRDYTRKKAASLVLKALLPDWEKIVSCDVRIFSRNDPEVVAWKRHVLERDGHRCRECGAEYDLHVHHILSWSEFPRFRVDPDNGITLCRECHADQHVNERSLILSTGGRGDP